MALHHIKEDKNLPQSYGISKDTHTSFYEYLTPNAQNKLNEMSIWSYTFYFDEEERFLIVFLMAFT